MIDILIAALQNYYAERKDGKSLEYTYGYMDALAALEEISRCVDLTSFLWAK